MLHQPRLHQMLAELMLCIHAFIDVLRLNADGASPCAESKSISATLFDLVPGGLREIHWHDVVEWAFVLRGTCRWPRACVCSWCQDS